MIHKWTEIHPTVALAHNVRVYQFATICEGTIVGEDCVIGSNVWIGRNCRVGAGTRIQDGAHITNGTVLGRNVFVGPRIVTGDDKHPRVKNALYVPTPPVFEDDCVIGMGAVILPGVRIGQGAMVAGGAIVTKDVPADMTVIGNAAKVRDNFVFRDEIADGTGRL